VVKLNCKFSAICLSLHCSYEKLYEEVQGLEAVHVFHGWMRVDGLSQRVQEGDYSSLVEVMGHLLAVKERQTSTDTMFEPLQQTIALLKIYEQELPEVVYKHLAVRTDILISHPFI
ncbi:hypothetical protein GOODEAATRI_010570, partial [Goodea atripinnis]